MCFSKHLPFPRKGEKMAGHRTQRISRRKSVINLFYIPAIVLFCAFVIFPFVDGIRISFTNWNGYSQHYKYVFLSNYIHFFQDENIRTAFINTLIYGFGSTLLQNVFGLAYAQLLNSKFRGRGIVRTIIYLPVMIASLIMGYIMYFIVQYNGGAINDIVMALGREPVDLMSNGNLAVFIIMLVNSFQYVGISMVIYLAGLQNIPDMYYEAAQLDGVGAWGKFRYITLPLLVPAISSAVVLNLIGGLKLFDVIMALTSGGPGYATQSLSTYITNQYFKAQNAGYASAVGILTFVFILIISTATTRYFSKKEVELG